MKKKLFLFTYLALTLLPSLHGDEKKALYDSLDPTSISEHLAFYELYKETLSGKKALEDAWQLISKGQYDKETSLHPLTFPANIDSFIQLIQPDIKSQKQGFEISDDALTCLENLASYLPNRSLKGNKANTLEEVLSLKDEEIDLAHALFLLQFGNDEAGLHKRRTYEAAIDLMALQVLAKVALDASPIEKIRIINQLIFYEMGFRFPPHSIYSESIDLFTFLPTVLESRRGVCLGVSTLYLAIAQRVALPLESVTPPGHIFLRYAQDAQEINIETTMRGVHIHSDEYLGLSTKKLKTRTMREVIGMSYVNQASVFLSAAKWEEAVAAYEKALPFMPNDPLVQELLGCSYLFIGKENEGKKLLARAAKSPSDDTVTPDKLIDDVLEGKVDAEHLKPYFMHVDESRKSIEAKRDALIKSCKRFPEFRSGLFQIAALQLQLRRPREAIDFLEKLSTLDKNDLTCEYYLAALYHDRYNAPNAIKHLALAEEIAHNLDYYPRQLLELKVALSCSK